MRISDWSSDVCSSDLLVFLLCGLWHGASWTFVLWGAWHGGFLVLERMGLGTALRRAPRPLGWAYALVAVMFGWVLFRGADLGNTFDIWAGMVGLHPGAEFGRHAAERSEEHTSELQSLMRISYAGFCLQNKHK